MNKIIYVHIILSLLTTLSLQFDLNEDYENYDQKQGQIYSNLIAAQQQNLIQKKLDITQYADSNAPQKSPTVEIKQDYTVVENWPNPLKKLGAVSAVALDVYKHVVVFHRVNRAWSSRTFNEQNIYQERKLGPITEPTIITFDRDSGNVLNEWGSNLFYMPHGLHINGNFYYITDVALHQVFRFDIKNSTEKPDLILGEAFKPGRSPSKFCKPTSVASLENGDFFVADGYCNSRIIKFSFNGKLLLEWGKDTFGGDNINPMKPPNDFAIPHALTLVPDKNLLCVADRENGRVQCFYTIDGKFHSQYHSETVGSRIFSVDYANNTLFVVNGPERPSDKREVAGYGFNLNTGDLCLKFGNFLDPHDLAVTSDAREIYVGDLSSDNQTKSKLFKFVLNGVKPTMTREGDSNAAVKLSMHRGETAIIVGSIVLLFSIFTVGIAILISKRKLRGRRHLKLFHKFPWEKASAKNLFFKDYNKFEKIPQNDLESMSDNNQNEFT